MKIGNCEDYHDAKLITKVASPLVDRFSEAFDEEDIMSAAEELVNAYGEKGIRKASEWFKFTTTYQNRDVLSIFVSSPFLSCGEYHRDDCDEGFNSWVIESLLKGKN